jgi:hypothetical protein
VHFPRLSVPALFILLVGAGATLGHSAQSSGKSEHRGTKIEGYATTVTPDTLTLLDKKNQVLEIHTDKDYSSVVGIAAPITVWYTSEGGVNRLEDIIYPRRSAEIVPPDLLRANIKRTIILPRSEEIEDDQELVAAVSKYLSDNANWYVAPSDLAVEMASRVEPPGTSDPEIDPETGLLDMQRYLARHGGAMARIARQTHTDAVLEMEIDKVKASVRGGIASWDDVSEPVESRFDRGLTPFPSLSKGWVYAASVDFKLWSSSGKLLWKRRRGFAVMATESGLSGKYHERPLKQVYANAPFMQQWLVETLGQLAPPTNGVASPTYGAAPPTHGVASPADGLTPQ